MHPDLPSSAVQVRPCEERDVAAVREIYAHYVVNSLASFQLEPPGAEEIGRRRREIITRGLPYLVAEQSGEVIGYAYAAPYRLRPAYRYTVENSVYVRQECARKGSGRLLMNALIVECEANGLRQMVAVIGDSANSASIGLHWSLGFVMIGTIRSAGYKFGRWADIVLMQRSLGSGDSTRPHG